MGSIYRYHCSKCSKIDGEIFFGIGMMYPQNNIDNRLFACYDCGEVFPRNKNQNFQRCPKCKRKSSQLKFFESDEFGFEKKIGTPIKCPNCNEGEIILDGCGNWD